MPPDVPDLDAVADVVVTQIEAAVAPLAARQQTTDTELARLRDIVDLLRDRVVVVETKAHPPVDLTPYAERLAVLETRAPVPGPPGKDGIDGKDGKTRYRGVWGKADRAGELVSSGEPGDFCTLDKMLWYCHEPTTAKPGTTKAWQMVGNPDGH